MIFLIWCLKVSGLIIIPHASFVSTPKSNILLFLSLFYFQTWKRNGILTLTKDEQIKQTKENHHNQS